MLIKIAVVAAVFVYTAINPTVGAHVLSMGASAFALAGFSPMEALARAMQVHLYITIVSFAVFFAVVSLLAAVAVHKVAEQMRIPIFGDELPPEQY